MVSRIDYAESYRRSHLRSLRTARPARTLAAAARAEAPGSGRRGARGAAASRTPQVEGSPEGCARARSRETCLPGIVGHLVLKVIFQFEYDMDESMLV